ncbi:MAG: hypothetical protein ACXW0Z_02290 [Gemmatirosa sp.]
MRGVVQSGPVRRTIRRASLAVVCLAAVSPAVAAGAIGAQEPSRVSVAARVGTFRPAGHSELFRLVDRARSPGSGALRPTLVGGELRLRVTPRWSALVGVETGAGAVASTTRFTASDGSAVARQRTALDLTSVWTVGAEWRALRWRAADPESRDRLGLVLGAGGGLARYGLRHSGTFTEAEGRIAFHDEFRSAGRGAIGYASAGVEAPVTRWLALQADVRRQAGSAPMSHDFASFDQLDLGGTRFGVGVRLQPARSRQRR